MAELIYALCTLTSIVCAYLLLRRYRDSRSRLLLWSGICFVGLAINNIVLMIDKVVYPAIDLTVGRRAIALVALLALLYGFIFDDE
jgi:hypothetical protein